MASNDESWEKYQKMVIDKLDNHSKRFEEVAQHLTKIQVEIATLKVKASIWGGIAGMIPLIIAILLFFSTEGQTK